MYGNAFECASTCIDIRAIVLPAEVTLPVVLYMWCSCDETSISEDTVAAALTLHFILLSPACKVATHFVLLFSLLVKLHCTLCCCCLSLQSCNAFCAAIFPACKDAEQFSLLFPCLQSCNASFATGCKVAMHLLLLLSLPAKLQCRAVCRHQVHPTPQHAHDTHVPKVLQATQSCDG
jgi:hypothetical protein